MSDPRQKDFDERHTKLPTVQALTKREYFAIQFAGSLTYEFTHGEYTISDVASTSIALADELIKQLS